MEATNPEVRQEGDVIRTMPVVAALLGACIFAGGMVLWGWLEMRAGAPVRGPRATAPTAAAVGPPAVAGVLQTLIGVDSSTAMLWDRGRERLDGWGWVDRARGVVRIPIEAAMRVVVEEERP